MANGEGVRRGCKASQVEHWRQSTDLISGDVTFEPLWLCTPPHVLLITRYVSDGEVIGVMTYRYTRSPGHKMIMGFDMRQRPGG